MPWAARGEGLTLCLLLFLRRAALCWATHNEESLLLAFKDRIENWDAVYASRGMKGWTPYTDKGYRPVCTWTGISCDPFGGSPGDQVTALELPCVTSPSSACTVPMIGTLLPELANLQYLKKLDLQGNALYSSLPPYWGFNDTFPQLVILDLNANNLTGPIPDEWSTNYGFQSLQELHLAQNQLTGSAISKAWADSKTSWYSLMVWNVANNHLVGSLPSYINGLITMSVVALQGNRITGTLSPDWGRQGWSFYNQTVDNDTQALEQLLLHDNLLRGPIPVEWGTNESFTVLKMLTLGENPLETTLPAWDLSGGLSQLQTLNISHAKLKGTLPDVWAESMTGILTISLEDNALSGSIPASWAAMPTLGKLYVQPGNADLCPLAPANASFKVCIADDTFCRGPVLHSSNPACNSSVIYGSGSSQSGSPSATGSGGTMDVPVAAIAAPISVVAALLVATAGFIVYRRRRRLQGAMPVGASFKGVAVQSGTSKLSWNGKDGDAASWYDGVGPGGGSCPNLEQVASVEHSAQGSGDRSEEARAAILAGAMGGCHPSASALVPGDVGLLRNGSRPQLHGKTTWQGQEATNPSTANQGQSCEASSSDGLEPAGPFATAPQPEWGDVLVHRDSIEMCRNAQGELVRLGGGASGEVYKAVLHGITTCAVKVHKFGSSSPMGLATKGFVQEASVLWKVCHPSIVQFLGASVTEGEGLLIMELMAGGDLAAALQLQAPDGSGRLYSWWNRGRRVALQVANGLAYLHSKRIVHCDLKSQNVLLSREGDAKIADVGFSRVLHADRVSSANMQGTFDWCAPEVLLGQHATVGADIYSLGILLWQICTGEMPRRGFLRALSPLADCPPEVAELQLRCTAPEPSQRPSAAEVVELLRAYQTIDPSGRRTSCRSSLDGVWWQEPWELSPILGYGAAQEPPPKAEETMIRSVRMSSGANDIRVLTSPLTAAMLTPFQAPGPSRRAAAEEPWDGLGRAGVRPSLPGLQVLSPHSISDPTPGEGKGRAGPQRPTGPLSPFELSKGPEAVSPFEALRSPADRAREAGLHPWQPTDLVLGLSIPGLYGSAIASSLQASGGMTGQQQWAPSGTLRSTGAAQLARSHSAPLPEPGA